MSIKNHRPALSRDLILHRGIAHADANGLSSLSMRKLAADLGVEAMSLYNHVTNKADLLDGMLDLVAGEFAATGLTDWQQEMRRRAHRAHDVLTAHPWAAMMFLTSATPGPNMLAYVERTLACLIGAGFTYPQADHIWNALDAHVYGYTIQRQAFPFAPEDYAKAAAENLHLIPAALFPHLRGMAELVAAREHDGLQSLDFGLDFLLAGMEAMRPSA